MLYALLEYLEAHFNLPGTGLFQYLSFRSACAIIFALLIGAIFGKKIIERLRRHQIGEEIRNLGLEGQMEKRGTPTMGGMIILGAMLIPVVLFCDLGNVYVQLMTSPRCGSACWALRMTISRCSASTRRGSRASSRLSAR